MPGGKSFHNAKVTVAASPVYDIVSFDVTESAEEVDVFADNRFFPQEGCSVRGDVNASITTHDASILKSSGGTVARGTAGALVITVEGNGTEKDMICTMSRAKCVSVNTSGGYGQAAQVKADFALKGTGGVEPTVVWTAAS